MRNGSHRCFRSAFRKGRGLCRRAGLPRVYLGAVERTRGMARSGSAGVPHVLDATKCISYLTIELRTPIPVEHREPIGNWLYGCDVCQDVCPWNRMANANPAFPHTPELAWLDPIELLGLDADEFRKRFK